MPKTMDRPLDAGATIAIMERPDGELWADFRFVGYGPTMPKPPQLQAWARYLRELANDMEAEASK